LEEVERVVGPRPLHVLRAVEVTLGPAREVGHGPHLVVAEHRLLPRLLVETVPAESALRVGIGMGGPGLRANSAVLDRAGTVDAVRVAVHVAVHQRGAHPLHRRHDGRAPAPRRRIGAERHARSVGHDHALEYDGGRRRHCRQALRPPVVEHRFSKRRAPDIRHPGGHLLRRHEQMALQLPGKRVLGGVLIEGRRPNRHAPLLRRCAVVEQHVERVRQHTPDGVRRLQVLQGAVERRPVVEALLLRFGEALSAGHRREHDPVGHRKVGRVQIGEGPGLAADAGRRVRLPRRHQAVEIGRGVRSEGSHGHIEIHSVR
jgi:hypothetical protein